MNRTVPQQSPEIIAAMNKLRMGDNEAAFSMAEAALAGGADPAPLHALAGLAAQRMNAPMRAIPHLQQLLEINPEDTASRVNLGNAFLAIGDEAAALKVVSHGDDPRLTRIRAYLHQTRGSFADAAAAYRKCIEADPNDLAAWNNLGNVLVELGETDAAIEAFEMAITLAPGDLPIYLNLAELLREADRPEARCKVLQDAHALAPQDQSVMVDLAMAHVRLDEYDKAIALLKQAIDQSNGYTDAYIELGLIYESLNRVEDLSALVDSIDKTDSQPEVAFLEAWKARREGRFEDAAKHADKIPETVRPMRRFHLIGGIAERLGDADGAYSAFEQMNREAVASSPPHSGPTFREEVEADLAKWTDDWASDWKPFEAKDQYRDPVFLVGFPRSGTTLLDTMLMGLDELSVLEERPMMARTLKTLAGEDLPELSSERIHELRDHYFGEARKYGWDDGRWLVDKHPLNMERVPAIHRLFPRAKVILAERHPYDVVLSCFMANFQLNLAMRSFSNLDEAARTYDAVFSAWKRGLKMFPLDYRAVRYERLIDDPRRELEPLVEWLGLEWNDRLLAHTETARERGRVRTASYSQIGEKLYSRAAGRWHRYADHLEPVIPILEPWAEKLGYETDR